MKNLITSLIIATVASVSYAFPIELTLINDTKKTMTIVKTESHRDIDEYRVESLKQTRYAHIKLTESFDIEPGTQFVITIPKKKYWEKYAYCVYLQDLTDENSSDEDTWTWQLTGFSQNGDRSIKCSTIQRANSPGEEFRIVRSKLYCYHQSPVDWVNQVGSPQDDQFKFIDIDVKAMERNGDDNTY